MLILAFDTCMAACSVAVWRDGAVLAARREVMTQGQAEALMPLIEATMTEAGVAFDALARIAVTVGPGSFTGVRVGLAAARGFALALKIPTSGATSGEVLARGAAKGGTVISLIDTKRGDVYVEAFRAEGTRLTEASVHGADDLGWLLTQGWPQPFTFVGDGATLAGQASARLYPDPALLAEIAATREPRLEGPVPLYVRPPSVTVAGP